MLFKQKIAMMIVCVFVFIFILELVRRRRLREEYSWLWLLTSVCMFILVLKYDWLVTVSKIVGATLPTTTLFIGALLFLMVLSVQFSVRISGLTNQVKNLVQENSILRARIGEIDEEIRPRT
ncbi:MAG: DUF2304 domain-containing protein [Deltaproteobacteria bacterium]|nr:DUF2304 domain-containing protein [Deltaproteobacteria bacterium]